MIDGFLSPLQRLRAKIRPRSGGRGDLRGSPRNSSHKLKHCEHAETYIALHEVDKRTQGVWRSES